MTNGLALVGRVASGRQSRRAISGEGFTSILCGWRLWKAKLALVSFPIQGTWIETQNIFCEVLTARAAPYTFLSASSGLTG
jgi:hypothetical protein